MSRIALLTLLICLTARTAWTQEVATPPATEQPAEQSASEAAGEPASAGGEPATAAPTPSPEAAAARGAFDALHRQWKEVIDKIPALQEQRRAAQGEARAALDKQVADLYAQADDLIDQITEAGVVVYKADPKAYEDVNDTLLAVARFHLTGDPNGDGGDQYEKAIKLIKGLLDAGAGETWPQLYLWGGIAAFNTNDFELAESIFPSGRLRAAKRESCRRILSRRRWTLSSGCPS